MLAGSLIMEVVTSKLTARLGMEGGGSWEHSEDGGHRICALPAQLYSHSCFAWKEKTPTFPGGKPNISMQAAAPIHPLRALSQLLSSTQSYVSKQERQKAPHYPPPPPPYRHQDFGMHHSLSPHSRCSPLSRSLLSLRCIIYPLGNICWDLVFNNCHSNISFLNPPQIWHGGNFKYLSAPFVCWLLRLQFSCN